ncbi:MAG: hypothetical protein WB402_10960 [Sulfuricaulis sp.]|uniref:hypothetical protein n=1 Tax=Sulfuricaulis sp. TaxID=2003553 RepID=UPI003C3D87D2
MKKFFLLSKVYGWLPPGPVALVTSAQKGCANVISAVRIHPFPLFCFISSLYIEG